MTKIAILFIVVFLSLNTFADGRLERGDKVGNGGGLWVCSSNRELQKALLIDLYEAEEEFGLSLISYLEADPMKIVRERSEFIRLELAAYSAAWNRILAESLSKIRMINSELIVVDDALFRVKPPKNSCDQEWQYVQFANYTNQNQILIRKDLWESPKIAASHKAALIWHEVIYKWLREHYRDSNSVRARQIVGLLFSTLPASVIQDQVAKILTQIQPSPEPLPEAKLWICMVNNKHTSTYFAGRGTSQMAAKSQALNNCQTAEEGFFCSKKIECEEIVKSHNQHFCQIENRHIGQVYWGEGRSPLEAEFNARSRCQDTPEKFFCSTEVTCE